MSTINDVETLQNELKKLKQKNLRLMEENNSYQQLKIRFNALQIEYDSLKQNKKISQNKHNIQFWGTVERKLNDNTRDNDHIKALIKDHTLTMFDTNQYGRTLLLLAVDKNNYEIAQLCLNLGADINHKDVGGMTAIDKARFHSHYHIEQLLLFHSMGAGALGERIKKTSFDINKQQGIIENIISELSLIGDQSRDLFGKILSELMINIISKKLVFSEDLLNLCWHFEGMKGDPLSSELWQSISKTCQDVIKNKNKRDWHWMKTCVIPSEIWYNACQKNDIEEKKETENDIEEKTKERYLYYELLDLVKEESQNQLNKLQENLVFDASNDKDSWNKLITFDIEKNKLTLLKAGADDKIPQNARQDNIPNGIVAEYSKNQLNHDATNSTFQGAKYYDHHQYLSKLSLLAQIVDHGFQKSVQKIFCVDKKLNMGTCTIDDGKFDVMYSAGPVKLLERARAKAESDYFEEQYPTSACVLDLNRCSLVFKDIKSLLLGLRLFINKVGSHQGDSVIGIVRVKNGFKQYIKTPQYADVKLNVLIRGASNNIIGEIQFLLQTMVRFKSNAHNLYAIGREEEFISQSASRILPLLSNKKKQLNVCTMIEDVKGLCNLMVFRNIPFSDLLFIDFTGEFVPVLEPICRQGKLKMFKFILSMMNEKQIIEHIFRTKYTNRTPIECAIQMCHTVIIQEGLKNKVILKYYQENKQWLFRLMFCLFDEYYEDWRGGDNEINVEIVGGILKMVQLTNQQWTEMIDYRYPKKAPVGFRFAGKQKPPKKDVWDNLETIIKVMKM